LARVGYRVTIIGVGGETATCPGVETRSYSGGTGWAKPVLLARLERDIKRGRFDVLQCLDPWTLLLGLRLKRARPGLRLIYESSEWFPRMFIDRKDLPWLVRNALSLFVAGLERTACRVADAILETNETRAERFLKKGTFPVLVPNYPPLELLPEPRAERRPWIVYTGLVSPHRGFEVLLRALSLVVGRYPTLRLRVIGGFDRHGGFEQRVRRLLRQWRLTNTVDFLGVRTYPEMFAEVSSCLAGVVLLQPERGNDYTGLPNKLFEFMGAGLGVVVSDFPELSRVVRHAGCGWLVDPTRPDEVARVLEQVLSSPDECLRRGASGRKAVLERFHWEIAEAALLKVYRGLMSS
jgi:glycosyltransferase involved in cell wall biosynthesis